MRILMLGWEFPPFMAGGLGTAVDGLTQSLVSQGHEVVFVLPQPIPEGHVSHVELIGPRVLAQRAASLRAHHSPTEVIEHSITQPVGAGTGTSESMNANGYSATDSSVYTSLIEKLETFKASSPSSYPGVDAGDVLRKIVETVEQTRDIQSADEHTNPDQKIFSSIQTSVRGSSADDLARVMESVLESLGEMGTGSGGYGSDLFGDSQRYARLVAALGMTERFDVIHAHDWLTYPAGLMLKAITGKPLVCHIHATEFDRSGEHINQGVYDIERTGLHGADRVIAVSRLTKAIVSERYGVDNNKVDVVYNGVAQDSIQPTRGAAIEKGDRIVLFLGRITMQKGPEYFIEAAKRVLEKED